MPAVGASAKNAAEMFVNDINKAGGLEVAGKKQPLTLVIGDNAAKADQAAAVAQRLISQDNVIAMIGPDASACAIPASEIAESLKCLMISPWSTNPKTTVDATSGKSKQYVFRACFIDTFQARVLAKFVLNNLNARTAVLYDVASEAPNGQANLFKETFEESGGSVWSHLKLTRPAIATFPRSLPRSRRQTPTLFFFLHITMMFR